VSTLHSSQFYFPLSSLLLHKSHRSKCPDVLHSSSGGSLFAYSVVWVGGWGLITNEAIFLIDRSIMALEAVKCNLFLTLHLLIFFLSLFTYENEGEIQDYCNCLFLKQFNSFNCFFRSCIVRTANIFSHVSLSDFVFLLEILDQSYRCLEGEVYF
jgi:hypothetical protein